MNLPSEQGSFGAMVASSIPAVIGFISSIPGFSIFELLIKCCYRCCYCTNFQSFVWFNKSYRLFCSLNLHYTQKPGLVSNNDLGKNVQEDNLYLFRFINKFNNKFDTVRPAEYQHLQYNVKQYKHVHIVMQKVTFFTNACAKYLTKI